MASRRDHRNVLVLATCQALSNSARTLILATGPLIGYGLSGDKALATLPSAFLMAGSAIAAFPAAQFMQRVGRRTGFSAGSLIGIVGALLTMYALASMQFWLFGAGLFLFGSYNAFTQQYRFAAADVAPDDFKSKAISLVLAGGIVAGFIGPEVAKYSRDLIAGNEFLGTYGFLLFFVIASGLLVLAVDIPKPHARDGGPSGRPLPVILRQPEFVVAALTASIGFAVMVMLMTATPIIMTRGLDFPFSDAAFVIEWHIFAMFAPGFFTGHLINRFGILRIVTLGNLFLAGAIATALSGQELSHFWIAMFLVGIGWNFTFTGGSVLLTRVHAPAERGKTQGANEVIIASVTTLATFSSGALYHLMGWNWIGLSALPLVALSLAASLWLARQHRAAPEGNESRIVPM